MLNRKVKPDLRVVAEGIRFSYGASIVIYALSMLIPVVIAYIFWGSVSKVVMIGWVLLLWLLYVVRITMAFSFQKQDRSDEEALDWGRVLAAVTVPAGTLWGLAVVLFYSHENLTEVTILLVTIATMASGSLINRSYWLPEAYAFTLPAIGIPVIFMLSYTGGEVERAMGLLLLIYLAMIIPLGKALRNNAYKLIGLKFENDELLMQMEEQKNRAVAANRAKTRFLASANHDLRQPVNALGFLTYAMKKELTSTEGYSLYLKLEQTVKNLGGLLESLLDLSRLDADTIEFKTEVVDVGLVARQMMIEFVPMAAKKGLRFTLGPQQFNVLSDKVLLERVIRNLIGNAIRYTREGGILFGCRKRGDYLSIEVWDTGCGISDTEMGQIFDEFYQVDNPGRDRGEGLGLGLPICQRIVKLMGHELTVSSQYGKGSTFRLVVPLASRAAYKHVQSLTPGIEGELLNDKLILIVDDDQHGLDAFSAVVQSWGMNVLTAADSLAAGKMLEENYLHPDVLIADFRLRDETGLDVIRKIKKQSGEDQLPAMIVTGDTAPERLKILQESGYPVLHKPVAPEQLYSALVNLLYPESLQEKRS